MFTVNLNEKTYRVFFRYGVKNPNALPHNQRKYTECIIMEKQEPEDVLVVKYKEYCSLDDNFERNSGRKKSLTHALNLTNFSRKDRELFWQAYFEVRGFKEKLTKHGLVFVPNY